MPNWLDDQEKSRPPKRKRRENPLVALRREYRAVFDRPAPGSFNVELLTKALSGMSPDSSPAKKQRRLQHIERKVAELKQLRRDQIKLEMIRRGLHRRYTWS